MARYRNVAYTPLGEGNLVREDLIKISKRRLLCFYAVIMALWLIVGLSVGLTQRGETTTSEPQSTTPLLTTTPPPPPLTDPILIIWGYGEREPEALVTNTNGNVGEIKWSNEKYASAESRCAIEHENQLFILGAYFGIELYNIMDYDRILRVDNCQLTRVGSLVESMKYASCARTRDTILICFSEDYKKRCYKGPDPLSLEHIVYDSTYSHYKTYISASNGKVLI